MSAYVFISQIVRFSKNKGITIKQLSKTFFLRLTNFLIVIIVKVLGYLNFYSKGLSKILIEVVFMKKFGNDKIALFLACTSVLSVKTQAIDTTKVQNPQTVAAAVRATSRINQSVKQGLTKNQKLGIIAAASFVVASAVGFTIWGVNRNKNSNPNNGEQNSEQAKTDANEEVIEKAIYDRKNSVYDFLKLEPQNEKKLHINIQKFKKLMNNRDFFDKNFIEFSYNKEGGPHSSYAVVRDKAEAEKILSFDTIFNTLKYCFSDNIKLTEFLISGNNGDYFGFDFGNGVKIYIDFTQNKKITTKYLSKQYHCRQYTFGMPDNN